MDRRSLLDADNNMPEGMEPTDVFSDENEVEDYDFVVDGFRPEVPLVQQSSLTRPETRREEFHQQPVRTTSSRYASNAAFPFPSAAPSRTSTRKSRNLQNPFASPEDAESLSGRYSLQFEPDQHDVRRSISSASSTVYARTHSPRFGASAPSHPYDMYPQNTIPRSPSAATTSTVMQPGRLSSSHGGPQHPYAMYTQGVDEDHSTEDEDDELIQQNPVPVGFVGLGNTYRRRMGPDGEDQDIIGQDGHTEQLPPYSRYPEDGPEKMPLLEPSVPSALHSRAPVHGSDPGMPLMHTVLQPVQTQQSMTDESALEISQSRSDLALIPSRTSRSSTNNYDKKSWSEKSWKDKRNTRICQIPVWWFLIFIGIFVFVAAVLGGSVGGYLAGQKQNINQITNPSVVTVVSLYDASTIASPTSSPPPTGTYALSLSTPQETQSECLVNTSQQVAWDCNLVPNGNGSLAINVTMQNNTLGANIFYASSQMEFLYGAQAPNLMTQFAEFLTVQDNDDVDDGPAFYFQQTYNKVVVVPEDAFVPPSNKFKRDYFPTLNRDSVTPGQKPWFCVWNNTLLEAFIYIDKKMAPSSTVSSTTSMSSSSTSMSTSRPGFPVNTAYPTQPSTGPDFMTTTFVGPSTTATYAGPSTAYPSWLNQHKSGDGNPNNNYNNKKARQAAGDDSWSSFAKYPNVIKLEERRVPSSNMNSPAYCQQYQILWDGTANWVADAHNNPIKILLDEQDPGYSAYQSAGLAGSGRKRSDAVQGGCHCQWMSGE